MDTADIHRVQDNSVARELYDEIRMLGSPCVGIL